MLFRCGMSKVSDRLERKQVTNLSWFMLRSGSHIWSQMRLQLLESWEGILLITILHDSVRAQEKLLPLTSPSRHGLV